jgi:hypothetical protein
MVELVLWMIVFLRPQRYDRNPPKPNKNAKNYVLQHKKLAKPPI